MIQVVHEQRRSNKPPRNHVTSKPRAQFRFRVAFCTVLGMCLLMFEETRTNHYQSSEKKRWPLFFQLVEAGNTDSCTSLTAPYVKAPCSADKWFLIENDDFPTDDMIVAVIIMTPDRLPSDPSNEDCSQAFITAFEEASKEGGGTVYVPEGQYLFANPIEIAPNVVLRGAWSSVTGLDKTVRGTILKVTYEGLDTSPTDRGFIGLSHRSGLRDLTIWYPHQSLDNVIPYARTIENVKPPYARFVEEMAIQNVNLVNSYVAIAPRDNARRAHWQGVYGSPLKLGMSQAWSTDVPTYANIHFSADYWSGSGLPGAPSREELSSYLKNHATGIKFGSSNNTFIAEWHVSDYNVGIHFVDEGLGVANGNFYGLYTSNCWIGLLIDGVAPTFFIDSTFQAEHTAVVINKIRLGGIHFNGCRFESSHARTFSCEWNGFYARKLTFQNCFFNHRLVAGNTDLGVINSHFAHDSGPPIRLSSKTKSVLFVGNTFHEAAGDRIFDLNGADPEGVVVESSLTRSKKHSSFLIDGYIKERKPKAANMIAMGTAGYDVHVDGKTDDSAAIQNALNEIALKGGGIAFLPQLSQDGYAIRGPLDIPSGVELRSSAEHMHSVDGRHAETPAALLAIYYGRGGNKPCITLSSGSGLKGFTMHYPEQSSDSIVPYSVTVRAIGHGAYVQNNHFVNSYSAVEFINSNDHLAANNMIQHIFRPIVVINCQNGRLNHNFIKDEWDDTNFEGSLNLENVNAYSIANNVAYSVIDSRNQQIYASFSHMSNWLGVFENSSVQTLQFSMEASHNGIKINGIPSNESVELIGSSLRVDRDLCGEQLSVFDVNAKSKTDGEFKVISSLVSGYPDTILKADNLNAVVQSSLFRLTERKVGRYGIRLSGKRPGVVKMENCLFEVAFVATNVSDADGKRLELIGCRFEGGVDNFFPTGQKSDPSVTQSSTRISEVATLVRPTVCAQIAQRGSSGLMRREGGCDMHTREFSSYRWFATVTGCLPSNGKLVFEVTSSPFPSGSKIGASLIVYYYDWMPGEINIDYKLPGNSAMWQNVGTIVLHGDNGFELPNLMKQNRKAYKRRNTDQNPHFHLVSLPVPGKLFEVGTLIRITVRGKALFSYLSLTSNVITVSRWAPERQYHMDETCEAAQ